MTPQEIFEHKLKWKPGIIVDIHSDLANEAKTWCRRNVAPESWSFDSWVGPYAHRFTFEDSYQAYQFHKTFEKWVEENR